MNSILSIEQCLRSIQQADVGEVIVVDAHSTDGTRDVLDRFATTVLEDPGIGLGYARNVGIAQTNRPLVLNLGSDNTITRESLIKMIQTLEQGNFSGVGAVTVVSGDDYLSRSMNLWRRTRFTPGEVEVIGTPTLFRGELLRSAPFDVNRQHSDDSELCSRWRTEFDARFAISDATVQEIGKCTWPELRLRSRNYGYSDFEVFSAGSAQGWSLRRKVRSLTHPFRMDVAVPVSRAGLNAGLRALPFLCAFAGMRYLYWLRSAIKL